VTLGASGTVSLKIKRSVVGWPRWSDILRNCSSTEKITQLSRGNTNCVCSSTVLSELDACNVVLILLLNEQIKSIALPQIPRS